MKKISIVIFLAYCLIAATKTQEIIKIKTNFAFNACLAYVTDNLWICSDINENQNYYYIPVSQNTIQIKNKSANLCAKQSALDTELTYDTCASSNDQYFEIIPKSDKGFGSVRIKNVEYDQCLDITRSLDPANLPDMVTFKTCLDVNQESNKQDINIILFSLISFQGISKSPNALTEFSKVSQGNCGDKMEYSGIKASIFSKDISYQISNNNDIFKYNADEWTKPFNLKAKEITISKNGTIYIISEDSQIQKYNGTNFTPLSKSGKKISSSDNNLWIIDTNHRLFNYDGTDWTSSFEYKFVVDVSIGSNETVWCLTYDQDDKDIGYLIWRLDENGSSWTQVNGRALKIAVGPDGNAWIVNNKNVAFEFNGYGWDKKFEGVTDISVGSDGAVSVVGTETQQGGFTIYKYDNC